MVGSNPVRDTDLGEHLYVILAVGRSPVQGVLLIIYKKQKKLRGFSPQANYTDRATDACRRS
jgi:hypothetical protein